MEFELATGKRLQAGALVFGCDIPTELFEHWSLVGGAVWSGSGVHSCWRKHLRAF